MCYNTYMKKFAFLLLISCLAGPVAVAANTQQAAPLLVGGNFSAQSNNPAGTRAFTQDARDGEVARLRE